MAPELARLLETAKSLKRDQIADLAHELIRVLDDDVSGTVQDDSDHGLEAAWHGEFRNRIDEIESGEVELVGHAETVSEARALLAARRK